jgi:hypothetical protein
MTWKCDTPDCIHKTNWVNDEQRLMWCVVLKSASTSLRSFLSSRGFRNLGNDEVNPDDYFKFGVVRNPWDRTVACHALLNQYMRQLAPVNFDIDFADLTFDVFVERMFDEGCRDCHWAPIVETTPSLDFTVQFGKIQETWKELSKIKPFLGVEKLPRNLPFGALHREHVHYSTYYTEHTKHLIASYYAADIEAFGFEFEDR